MSSGLSGIVLPPPVVDPFSSNANVGSFPKDDFSTLTTAFGQDNNQQEFFAIKPPTAAQPPVVPPSVSPAAPVSAPAVSAVSPAVSNSSANESFANFDAVQFDTIAGKILYFE